jgi:hypothetical protein
VLLGTFVATVLGLCGAVSLIYPDKISVPKSYEDGLEAELGGPRTVRVSIPPSVPGESVLIGTGEGTWRGSVLEALRPPYVQNICESLKTIS